LNTIEQHHILNHRQNATIEVFARCSLCLRRVARLLNFAEIQVGSLSLYSKSTTYFKFYRQRRELILSLSPLYHVVNKNYYNSDVYTYYYCHSPPPECFFIS